MSLIIDGYDMSDWFVRETTPEQGVRALRAAGIPPDEYNVKPEQAGYALKPPSQFLFIGRGDDVQAQRA